MLVGTIEEVDAFIHTTPWGMEQTVGFYNWTLDGEPGWSVMVTSDPTKLDSEGIIFGYDPGKERAALIGCGSYEKVRQLAEELDDRPLQEIRELALLLKRDLTGRSKECRKPASESPVAAQSSNRQSVVQLKPTPVGK